MQPSSVIFSVPFHSDALVYNSEVYTFNRPAFVFGVCLGALIGSSQSRRWWWCTALAFRLLALRSSVFVSVLVASVFVLFRTHIIPYSRALRSATLPLKKRYGNHYAYIGCRRGVCYVC